MSIRSYTHHVSGRATSQAGIRLHQGPNPPASGLAVIKTPVCVCKAGFFAAVIAAVVTATPACGGSDSPQGDYEIRRLRTAATAAQAVYGIVLPSGVGNFAAEPVSDGRIGGAVSAYDGRASRAAVEALVNQEPALVFQAKADYGDIAAKAADFRDNGAPMEPVIWVQVNGVQIDSGDSGITLPGETPNGYIARTTVIAPNTAIRTGDLIRLGVVTADGRSFCVIIVADSTGGAVSGDGWRGADAAFTAAGAGADCGSEAIGSDGASSPEEYRSMPGTAGVDPALVFIPPSYS